MQAQLQAKMTSCYCSSSVVGSAAAASLTATAADEGPKAGGGGSEGHVGEEAGVQDIE